MVNVIASTTKRKINFKSEHCNPHHAMMGYNFCIQTTNRISYDPDSQSRRALSFNFSQHTLTWETMGDVLFGSDIQILLPLELSDQPKKSCPPKKRKLPSWLQKERVALHDCHFFLWSNRS